MVSPTVPFPLLPDDTDVEFRFTIKTARDLERATRPFGGIAGLHLRGSNVEALVVTTLYALRWNKPKLTEDKVVDMMQAFVDAGGDVVALTTALSKALNESGVYGKPEKPEDESQEGDGNPSPPETETPTT